MPSVPSASTPPRRLRRLRRGGSHAGSYSGGLVRGDLEPDHRRTAPMSRGRAVGRLQGALATSRPRPEPDSLVAVRSDVHEPGVAMHDRFVDNRPGPTALVLVGKDLPAVAAQPAR